MKRSLLLLLAISAAALADHVPTGPDAGSSIPAFEAVDQNGNKQTLATLSGDKGLMLVFFRSADWCPFCKAQLVELEQNVAQFKAKGYGVAALSYDSPAILKHFADRAKITYSLLSDPESKVIRAFGILNEKVPENNFARGIPNPGSYLISRDGKVISKYFEDDYSERDTSAAILIREFGAAAGAAHTTIEAKHLNLSSSASTQTVRVGQHIVLALDIELKPKMHVYAPGVQDGYRPIEWIVPAAAAPEYPKSHILFLPAIDEKVPVYEGRVRLLRELIIPKDASNELVVTGEFKYQACDDKVCYIPATIPLKWTFKVEGYDRERAPADIRHR